MKRSPLDTRLIAKILWALGGAAIMLILAISIGGVYTITPPNGPADVAYKVNRFTGKVWLIKTYAKPLAQGQLRVIVAREAEVEKTRELSEEDAQAFIASSPVVSVIAGPRR